MSYCPKCSAEVKDGAKFCGKCGCDLNNFQNTAPINIYGGVNVDGVPQKNTANKKSIGLIVGIISAVIVIILLVVGVALGIKGITGYKTGGKTDIEIRNYEQNDDELLVQQFDINEISDIISSYTNESNVAVSICDLENNEVYETDNANEKFIAAGFYAPLYMIAYSGNDSYSKGQADQMMATMNNACANNIITRVGGKSYVNSVMSHNNFSETTFNRNFGDVSASKAGYENYTSAHDASRILKYVYEKNGYTKMDGSLKAENIYMPSGVYYYAHRGMGIKTAYNIFAVVDGTESSYAVAILTKDLGSNITAIKSISSPMITAIFSNIEKQMVNIYE